MPFLRGRSVHSLTAPLCPHTHCFKQPESSLTAAVSPPYAHCFTQPENFLFHTRRKGAPLKAIDFGLSVLFKPVCAAPVHARGRNRRTRQGPAQANHHAAVTRTGVELHNHTLQAGLPNCSGCAHSAVQIP